MKKKILIFIVLLMLGVLLAIKPTYAWTNVPDTNKYPLIDIVGGEQLASANIYSIGVMNDFNSASVWYYEIVYYTRQPFVIYNAEAINSTYLLWYGLTIDTDQMFYADTTDWFAYYNHQYIINTNNKTTMDNIIFYSEYDYGVNMQIYFGIDNSYTLSTPVIVEYLEEILTDLYIVNVTYDDFMLAQLGASYTDGYNSGYSNGRQQYGYYSGGNWFNASEQYTMGYNTAKNDFGLRAGVYGNANYWFSQGQLSQTDLWGSLLSAFFGIFQVLTIQILPGIELGYFVGFFLVLGVASMIIGSFMIRRK